MRFRWFRGLHYVPVQNEGWHYSQLKMLLGNSSQKDVTCAQHGVNKSSRRGKENTVASTSLDKRNTTLRLEGTEHDVLGNTRNAKRVLQPRRNGFRDYLPASVWGQFSRRERRDYSATSTCRRWHAPRTRRNKKPQFRCFANTHAPRSPGIQALRLIILSHYVAYLCVLRHSACV